MVCVETNAKLVTINYPTLTMVQNKIFIEGLARLAAKVGFPFNFILPNASLLVEVTDAVRSEMFCHLLLPL